MRLPMRLGVDGPGGRSPSYEDKLDLLYYKDGAGEVHPVETPQDWDIRRAHVLANMELRGMFEDDTAQGPILDEALKAAQEVAAIEDVVEILACLAEGGPAELVSRSRPPATL